jgi:hypothetical protein
LRISCRCFDISSIRLFFENNEIAEVGPGEVLTKLTRQIKKDAVPLPMPKEESDTADVKASAADPSTLPDWSFAKSDLF